MTKTGSVNVDASPSPEGERSQGVYVRNGSNCSSSTYLLFPEDFESFLPLCLHPIEKAAIIEQWKIDSASRCSHLARGSRGSVRFAFLSLPLQSWLQYPGLPNCPISFHNHLWLLMVPIKLHFGNASHCLWLVKVFAFSLWEVLENGLFSPSRLILLSWSHRRQHKLCIFIRPLSNVLALQLNFNDSFDDCSRKYQDAHSQSYPVGRSPDITALTTYLSSRRAPTPFSFRNYEDSHLGSASMSATKIKQNISEGLGLGLCR